MTLLRRLLVIAISTGLIVGCGSGSPAPKAKGTPHGRPETRAVEGATAAGYNGSQIRKKIDKVIDRTEERSREIDKGAPGTPSK